MRFIPEFGAQGKDGITLRHLLTHTAGIPNADGDPRRGNRGASPAPTTWPASTRRRSSRVWMPGKKAGYHAAAGMSRARRDRRAHERPAVRRVRARGDLRAARDARLLGRDARGSLRGVRRPHRSDAQHRRRRTGRGCAGSTRARADRVADARRERSRTDARARTLLRDAARSRHARRCATAHAPDGRRDLRAAPGRRWSTRRSGS